MIRHTLFAVLLAPILLCLAGADRPATQPADATLERDYREQTAGLGGQRSFDQGVLTISLPRTDLWVQADMTEVPTAAGVATSFYFFRCSCGKDRVVGQFCLADYEVNDVIDALRAGRIDVVSVSAMFLADKPRMMLLRFQAEGQAADLAKTLKSALNWIGDARTAHQPLPSDAQTP